MSNYSCMKKPLPGVIKDWQYLFTQCFIFFLSAENKTSLFIFHSFKIVTYGMTVQEIEQKSDTVLSVSLN